ncbi:hypothetical protein LCGC14_1894520 [marine sediment metagenome]|uniref:Uncharacterized protein n=1 Tax=marine sediment metagenome TaxID=412755 RepID=A0A0F9FYG1_9ZZZZ
MKIALYELAANESRFKFLNEAVAYKEKDADYIRVSNIIEVPFEMIDDAIIIPQKVTALRAEKAVVSKEFDEKIANLLAIEHKPE